MILAPREIIVAPRLITYGGGRKPSVLLLERIRESRRGEKKRGEFRFHDFFFIITTIIRERERLLSVRVVCFATPLKKNTKKETEKNNIMVIMN